jgi:hypothetical protein
LVFQVKEDCLREQKLERSRGLREKMTGDLGNYIARTSQFVFFIVYYSGGRSACGMGREYSMHNIHEKFLKNLVINVEEKRPLGILVQDGRVILKWN